MWSPPLPRPGREDFVATHSFFVFSEQPGVHEGKMLEAEIANIQNAFANHETSDSSETQELANKNERLSNSRPYERYSRINNPTFLRNPYLRA